MNTNNLLQYRAKKSRLKKKELLSVIYSKYQSPSVPHYSSLNLVLMFCFYKKNSVLDQQQMSFGFILQITR